MVHELKKPSPFKDKNGRLIMKGDRLMRISPNYKGEPTEWINIVGYGSWSNGVMEDPFTHHGWYILGASGSAGSSWYGELTDRIAAMSEVISDPA